MRQQMTRKILIPGGFIAAAAMLLMFSGSANAERCALVRNGNLEHLKIFGSGCPTGPSAKPQFKWLPAPVVSPPAYDPETQKRNGPFYTVGVTEVTESWSVVAKTPQEIDDDKTQKILSISIAMLKALCDHENRIRALESKSAITENQCKNGLKALLP